MTSEQMGEGRLISKGSRVRRGARVVVVVLASLVGLGLELVAMGLTGSGRVLGGIGRRLRRTGSD